MNILFLSHYFPPEGNAPASRVYEFSRRWAASGNEITVITSAPNVPGGVVYPGYRNRFVRENQDGIRVQRVWTYLAPNKGTVRRILNYLSYMFSAFFAGLAGRRPDVVVATSPQFFCAWAGLLLAICRRRPFVLEIRDIWPESITAVEAMRNRAVLNVLEKMEKMLYRRADAIVTVGEGYRQRLIEKGVPPGKISVVANGVTMKPGAIGPSASSELRARWCPDASFVCIYAGTIGMACGLDVVLRAADLLRRRGRENIHFLLVGDGAHREELESRSRAMSLRGVIFTGLQKRSDVAAFLNMADACLVHLRKTDLFTTVFPSKLLDAAALKRPVILGVEGHAAQMVREADCGICIEPENAEQLADAVLKLAADPELCRRFGENGAAYANGHFNADRLAAEYMELLTRIVS